MIMIESHAKRRYYFLDYKKVDNSLLDTKNGQGKFLLFSEVWKAFQAFGFSTQPVMHKTRKFYNGKLQDDSESGCSLL